jgi:hypothetical protein
MIRAGVTLTKPGVVGTDAECASFTTGFREDSVDAGGAYETEAPAGAVTAIEAATLTIPRIALKILFKFFISLFVLCAAVATSRQLGNQHDKPLISRTAS